MPPRHSLVSTFDSLFVWIWTLVLHLCGLGTSRPRTATSHDVELGVPALQGATSQNPSRYPPTLVPNPWPLYSQSQSRAPIVAPMSQPNQVVLTVQHSINVDSRSEASARHERHLSFVQPSLDFLLDPLENSCASGPIKPPTPRRKCARREKRSFDSPMWFKDPASRYNSPLDQGPVELGLELVFHHHQTFSSEDDNQVKEEDVSTLDILPDLDFSLSTVSSSSFHSIKLAHAEQPLLAYLQPISPSTSLNVRLYSGLPETEAQESRELDRLLEILELGCAGKHLSWPNIIRFGDGRIEVVWWHGEECWTEISLD